jgi:uncharacterized iron-regulated membrane protein
VSTPTRRHVPLSLRQVALLAHRYVGLAMAVFLVVAGATGTVLAFYHELDVALAPELFRATSPPQGERLDPISLHERALAHVPPGATIPVVPFDTPPGENVSLWVDLPKELKAAQHDNEYFFDAHSVRLIGTRHWGELSQGRKGAIPFIYRLHTSLALDHVGEVLLGIVALLWTMDCFVGAYLTFPVAGPQRASRTAKRWLYRWWSAWLIRARKLFSFIFTWHRAGGLWAWAMLLVFSWSSVGLNLHEVYDPVMSALYGGPEYELPKRSVPLVSPALSFRQAHEQARRLMAQDTQARGIDVYSERMLRYLPRAGLYEYRVYSSRDVSKRYATTTVLLDGNTGERELFVAPTGESLGASVTTWIYQLHFGTVAAGGWPYRLFVAAMGLVVVCLSVSGSWIWWTKRAKRRGVVS